MFFKSDNMRHIWSGTISFGLIHIPVRLYNATKESRLNFKYLRKKDLCPIKYMRICRLTGEEVPFKEIVRGYEYQKGDYVVLQDEDFKKASVKKTQTIEILKFVNAAEIDQDYLEKPFYLEPTKEAQKAYVLLREALKKSNKVGIAKFVLKTREHLAVIKPDDELLVLDQMRFKDELLDPKDLNIPKEQKYSKKELDIAIQLISQLTEPFRPEDFHDTYAEEIKEIVQNKARGKPVKPGKEEEITPTPVADIMAKLKESLEYAKRNK